MAAPVLLDSPPRIATAREAVEAVLGLPVPARAEFQVRPLIGVAARHHRDGPEAYEAEQLAGACGDAALRAAAVTIPRTVTVATIVRGPLAGDLLAAAGGRVDGAVVVAASWPV